jgi:hypothetical protein
MLTSGDERQQFKILGAVGETYEYEMIGTYWFLKKGETIALTD